MSTTVTLRIYDLSQGMARSISPGLLGKQIDGIWHTGIVVFDREYYFGGGICSDPPGRTPYGTPHAVEQMGATSKSEAEFRNFLSSITSRFSMSSYHLLDNNCNNFSDECCQFLLGKSIPQYILDLPSEAMNSPFGPMIRPMIEQMQGVIQQQSLGHEVSLAPSPSGPQVARSAASIPTTQDAAAPLSMRSLSVSNPYWSVPIVLEKADRKAVVSKLNLFAPQYKQNPEELLQLSLSLPPEKAFPALDLLRLHVAESAGIAEHFASKIQTIATRFILNEDAPVPACMMALRGAVNCFKHAKAAMRLCESDSADAIVESIAVSLTREKRQLRKTGALLALNLSGAHCRDQKCRKLNEDHTIRILFCIVQRLQAAEQPAAEEARPLLSALIILTEADADAAVVVQAFSLELARYQDAGSCEDSLTRTAATQLGNLLGK